MARWFSLPMVKIRTTGDNDCDCDCVRVDIGIELELRSSVTIH